MTTVEEEAKQFREKLVNKLMTSPWPIEAKFRVVFCYAEKGTPFAHGPHEVFFTKASDIGKWKAHTEIWLQEFNRGLLKLEIRSLSFWWKEEPHLWSWGMKK